MWDKTQGAGRCGGMACDGSTEMLRILNWQMLLNESVGPNAWQMLCKINKNQSILTKFSVGGWSKLWFLENTLENKGIRISN